MAFFKKKKKKKEGWGFIFKKDIVKVIGNKLSKHVCMPFLFIN